MRTLLTLLTLVLGLQLFAGNADSLRAALKDAKHDSVRIEILNKLAFEVRPKQPKEAEDYAMQALMLARKTNNKGETARSAHSLGTIYYLHAKYPEALQYYLESIRIRESQNDSSNLAKGYNNIALVYYEMGNPTESLKFHLKSVVIKKSRNDQKGLASSYGNIGNLYYEMGQQLNKRKEFKKADSIFDVCLKYHVDALKIQEEQVQKNPDNVNLQAGLAGTYNNIGNVYFEKALLNDNNSTLLELALDFHNKAIAIQEPIEDDRGLSHSYINMAGIYDKQKKFDKAVETYNKALKLLEGSGMREELKTIYEGLAAMYESKGDHKMALMYYKMFTNEKDSIFSIEQSRQFDELQLRYDTEKKERELDNKNSKLRIQQEQIEKGQLQERNLLVGIFSVSAVVVLIGILLFVIWNRYQLKTKTGKLLEEQNAIIAYKNKEITDSIRYAKRIQEAILPHEQTMKKLVPDSFVFYRAKDIVSGDFYWMEQWGDKVLIAAVDCTGHGVPGAFMSIVGYNLLSQAVNVYGLDKPNLILNHMNKDLYRILRQEYEDSTVKDGMDMSLIAIDRKRKVVEFAGAFNPLVLVRNGELMEIEADKFPVGAFLGEALQNFNNKELELQEGDMLYLFSDGYADQFGGEKGKKFKYKNFMNLLKSLSAAPVVEQKEKLEQEFDLWKGAYDQIDDVCIVGVRI